ncbi:MAG: hypothetical protein P1U32_01120 [Legionellaceae bacterium]|nr:hypothetical protein [Legionellaceae bacterium]
MIDSPAEKNKKTQQEQSRDTLKEQINASYATQKKLDDSEPGADSMQMEMKAKDKAFVDKAIEDYNKLCLNKDGTYKPGYEEPKKDKDGNVMFTFPTEEDAVNFFAGRAEKGESFEVYKPPKNELVAYSNGDGKLYRPDKSEIKPGDLFKNPNPDSSMTPLDTTPKI